MTADLQKAELVTTTKDADIMRLCNAWATGKNLSSQDISRIIDRLLQFLAPPRDGVVAEPRFPIGAFVQKTGGDYTFQGNVVALVWKRDGKTLRYVVENDGGMLFIFNGKQLERGTAMSSDRATLLKLMGEG